MPRIDRYTPKTIEEAFETCPKLLTKDSGQAGNINTCSVLTRIIQETGRFCERFASDMFITWQSVEKLYNGRMDIDCPETYYETFAIRRNGVDGNTFLMCRLKDSRFPNHPYVHPEQEYRRILGLKITIMPQEPGCGLAPDVTLELRDLTDSFCKVHPDDESEG